MALVVAVDDDEIICDFVMDVLEDAGHTVLTVMTGDDAIAKIELHRPDVVLLDCSLPGKSGTVILQLIQHDDLLNTIPIVMMTARRSTWSINMATSLGAKGYLRKPFSATDLITAISGFV